MLGPVPLRISIALCALAPLVAGCSFGGLSLQGAGDVSSPTTAAGGAWVDETPELAAEFVPVPGFDYAALPDQELGRMHSALPSFVSSAAFRVVNDAATGDEVAFIGLVVEDPTDAMHSPNYALTRARIDLEADEPTALDLSGQQVWFAEHADRPASRYMYAWERHGTRGWADGPDRASIERFLAGYFAVPFLGAESDLLGERMVDVPGYVLTNFDDAAKARTIALDLFPDADDATMHYVFDQTHKFGSLFLAGPVDTVTDDEIVATLSEWLAYTPGGTDSEVTALPDITVGDVTVHDLVESQQEMHVLVWRWPDTQVVGWLVTARPDLGVDFVNAFLAG